MRNKKFIKVLAGLVVGLVCGLFGGGGGMLVVPVLQHFFDYKAKNAHATAIAIILPLTIVATVFYLLKVKLKFELGLTVSCGVLVGGVIGAFALKKISSKLLSVSFSALMLVAGVKLLMF